MKFSPTTGCFYPEDIEYTEPPADLVDVQGEDYAAAMARQPGEAFELRGGRIVIIPAAPSPAHTWSGSAWVFDADRALEIKAAALSAQIASGYAAAQVQIDYLSRRKRLKRATAAELALLEAWEGHSLDLSDLRADPAWPEVTLPEAPAAAAPVTAGGA